jgi:hypothetical protein
MVIISGTKSKVPQARSIVAAAAITALATLPNMLRGENAPQNLQKAALQPVAAIRQEGNRFTISDMATALFVEIPAVMFLGASFMILRSQKLKTSKD